MFESTTDKGDMDRWIEESRWLRRLAYSLIRDASTADDAVQDVYLAALRDDPRNVREPRGWLAVVLRRWVGRTRRRELKRPAIERRSGGKSPIDDVDRSIEIAETQQILGRVLRELDDPFRTVLILRYFDDLTPTEIAERMGMPSGTVRSHLTRGLEKMRRLLDREYGDRNLGWRASLAVFLAPIRDGARIVAVSSALRVAAAILLLLGGFFVVDRSWLNEESVDLSEGIRSSDRSVATDREPIRAVANASLLEPQREINRTTVVQVRKKDGSPVNGARIVAFSAGEVFAHATSGTDGCADLGRLPNGTEVRADAPRIGVGRTFFQESTEPIPIVLEPSRPLIVRAVDISRRALPDVEISYFDHLWEIDGHPLPAMIADTFIVNAQRLGADEKRTVLTDTDGRAAIDGITSSFVPTLEFGVGIMIDREGQLFASVTPPISATEFEIVVVRVPIVRGRAVDGDTGLPIARAEVRVEYPDRSGDIMATTIAVTAKDGTFVFASPEYRPRWMSVSVHSGSIAEAKRISEVLEADRDLGDFILRGRRAGESIEFFVTNTNGDPVPTAVLTPEGGFEAFRPNVAARVSIDAAKLSSGAVEVAAPGYRPRIVRFDRALSREVVCVLSKSNSLEIRVSDALGRPASFAWIGLSSSENPFIDDRLALSTAEMESGAVRGHAVDKGADRTLHCVQTDAGGTLTMCGFDVGCAIRVAAIDINRQEFPGAVDLFLADDERKVVELKLPTAGQVRIDGRLIDTEGRPIVGALVAPQTRLPSIGRFTDSDGRFYLEAIDVDVIDLEISGDTVRDCRVNGVRLPHGEILVLTAERSRKLFVRTVDLLRRAIVAEVRMADQPSKRAATAVDGRVELTEAPISSFEVFATAGGRTIKSIVAESVEEVDIVFPIPGQITVRWTQPLDPGFRHRIVAREKTEMGVVVVSEIGPEARRAEVADVGAIFEGSYEISLERRPTGKESNGTWAPIAPAIDVVVVPDRKVDVRFVN